MAGRKRNRRPQIGTDFAKIISREVDEYIKEVDRNTPNTRRNGN